eukprot:scaffold15589_cov71-Attheya_sp.AAC.1
MTRTGGIGTSNESKRTSTNITRLQLLGRDACSARITHSSQPMHTCWSGSGVCCNRGGGMSPADTADHNMMKLHTPLATAVTSFT